MSYFTKWILFRALGLSPTIHFGVMPGPPYGATYPFDKFFLAKKVSEQSSTVFIVVYDPIQHVVQTLDGDHGRRSVNQIRENAKKDIT